ncbi:MAG TPA: hypothetical protein VLT45_18210 [Kofleriaceae bacterium]|nr:hypothetical protein [Kofleriaceae bacterium]
MMTTDTFLSHVAGHAGIPPDRAEQVTRSVLSGIAGYLTRPQRELVAAELPESLGSCLIESRALEPGLMGTHGRELVASVCHVLGEELSNDAMRVLRRALPRDLVELLAEPSREVATHAADSRHGTTLASGRPGSRHPVSEAAPARGQAGSIGDSNPHGGTKLSSSPGTTQERRHETLAESRPDERRSLAGDQVVGDEGGSETR